MRNSGVIQTHDYYANETEKDRAINAFKQFDPENDKNRPQQETEELRANL